MAKKVQTTQAKMRVRTGDTVRVLAGKDRGKKGSIIGVLPARGRVIVEGVNMVKKHVKPRRAGEKGQRVEVAAPMAVSNVQLVCPSCKKGTRVAISREGGVRQRQCKKCEAVVSDK